MIQELKDSLLRQETDLDGVLYRLSGDEDLYVSYLEDFLQDDTMMDLDSAMQVQAWDDAFTAAHALKGLAGNMGFVPLFHAAAELVVLIRTGKVDETSESYTAVKKSYIKITDIIYRYCNIGITDK